jgi:hypothetical protein
MLIGKIIASEHHRGGDHVMTKRTDGRYTNLR